MGGRAHLREARRRARACAEAAARAAGALGFPLARDPDGAPLPSGPWRWSYAHTDGLCAAVVAPAPVGIDVESRGRRRLRAALESARAGELDLLGGPRELAALRLWTIKEAVLKKLGCGLARLSGCRLVEVAGAGSARVELDGRRHAVRTASLARHELALACDRRTDRLELVDVDPLAAATDGGGAT